MRGVRAREFSIEAKGPEAKHPGQRERDKNGDIDPAEVAKEDADSPAASADGADRQRGGVAERRIDLGPVEVQGNFVVFLDFTRHALASSAGCDRTACQYKSIWNVKISFPNRAFRFKR